MRSLYAVAERGRLVDMLAREAIDDITFHEQKAEYEAEELKLRAKMDKINQSGDKFEEMADCIFEFAANAGKYFESSKLVLGLRGKAESSLSCYRKQENSSFRQRRKIDEKHELLKIIVSNSVATGSKVKVSLEKPFDFFVKNDERLLWRSRVIQFSNPKLP